jgi:hypothetical protein
MVAAAVLQADATALLVASGAAVAVLGSIQLPRAATIAVAACVVAIALSDPAPLLCALAGLNATCYLLLCRGRGRESITRATIVAVLASSAFGMVATSIPAQLPWVPLAAPLAVLVAFVIVVQPLVQSRRLEAPYARDR